MSEPPRDDLADQLGELEQTLSALRDELRPDRGPGGLPRPPTPGEVLGFTEEYAIPAAIAILEANVRTLELLQGVIRAVNRGEDVRTVRDRSVALSRGTLDRLDRALSRLETEIEAADLPRNADARRLLEEARELNAEIDRRIADAEATEGSGPAAADDTDEAVRIAVEDELDQLKDELDEDETEGSGDAEE